MASVNQFKRKFARVISTLFVPPSFTIIVFTIFAFSIESSILKKTIVLLSAYIFGFALPIYSFLKMRKLGKISDQDAMIKEQRTKPFLISIAYYFAGLFLLLLFEVSVVSIAFWICHITTTAIVILVNKFWKISVHSISSAGGITALFVAFGSSVLPLFILPVLVGWTRFELKCHSTMQIIAGLFFGTLLTYLPMILLIKHFS
ncbi:MAG: hypothetical protein HXY49_00870 [Ignavibacteriaceae bacterium]|nr:hypothetical protein [Ignavibacteriaceae bacterium]